MDAVLRAGWQGLLLLASWEIFWMVLLGIAIGYVIGVVPGIGGVVGLSVLLPFTFDMNATMAFALLLTVATVISNSSDFTAILFGVPGDGASGALVLDGRPMAKRGEAGRALSGNILASTVGSIFGAVVLIAIIPVVRPVVLSFGSPEFFALTILGISFVGSVSTGQPLKGLLSGLVGLLLATVGLSPALGLPRYTFGYVPLWDGVSVAVAALALFAIPELADLMMTKVGDRDAQEPEQGGVRRGLLDVWRHRWLVLRCSAIGTIAGILPGLGAASAQWMAYGHALQTSKDKEEFGRGSVEGALGPGAANNSGLGGSLVPTVAFGIPGNVITAILLGAFLIHGVAPGPSMLTDNLPLTMSFAWTVVIANLIAFGIFLRAVPLMTKVVSFRAAVLVPFLTIAIFAGAYLSGSQRIFSIVTMIALGAIAMLMVQLRWPRAPMILGLVLGGLSENYLLLSYNRYRFGFLERPLVLVILVLTLLVIFQPLLSRRKTRRQAKRGDAAEKRPARLPQLPEPRNRVLTISVYVGLVALSVAALLGAASWPPRMALMPRMIAVATLALSLLGLIVEPRRWRRAQSQASSTDAGGAPSGDAERYAGWSLTPILWLVASLAAVMLGGFVAGGSVLVLLYSRFLSKESWLFTLLAVAGTAVAVWFLGGAVHLRDPGLLVSVPPF